MLSLVLVCVVPTPDTEEDRDGDDIHDDDCHCDSGYCVHDDAPEHSLLRSIVNTSRVPDMRANPDSPFRLLSSRQLVELAPPPRRNRVGLEIGLAHVNFQQYAPSRRHLCAN